MPVGPTNSVTAIQTEMLVFIMPKPGTLQANLSHCDEIIKPTGPSIEVTASGKNTHAGTDFDTLCVIFEVTEASAVFNKLAQLKDCSFNNDLISLTRAERSFFSNIIAT